MKTLCSEYNRKAKRKPQNKVKMLNCLMKFLEYTDNGGALEQWKFLVALLKDTKEQLQSNFKG